MAPVYKDTIHGHPETWTDAEIWYRFIKTQYTDTPRRGLTQGYGTGLKDTRETIPLVIIMQYVIRLTDFTNPTEGNSTVVHPSWAAIETGHKLRGRRGGGGGGGGLQNGQIAGQKLFGVGLKKMCAPSFEGVESCCTPIPPFNRSKLEGPVFKYPQNLLCLPSFSMV